MRMPAITLLPDGILVLFAGHFPDLDAVQIHLVATGLIDESNMAVLTVDIPGVVGLAAVGIGHLIIAASSRQQRQGRGQRAPCKGRTPLFAGS